MKVKNPAYFIKWNESAEQLEVTHKGITKNYSWSEFVYGTGGYKSEVEKYPNYIHKQVWELYKEVRGE